jgi:RNA polymerase sigma-70 factor (ECF subfamily)
MLAVCMTMIDNEEDRTAFEKLYNKYKNKVYVISYNILKNEQLAEDAASDTFLSLAKSFQKIKNLEHHKLDYYIVISSKNTATNLLKKEKENLAMLPYDDDCYLSNKNLTNFDLEFLKECINQLTDTEQEILYLKFSLGLEYKDISNALDISCATARKRLQYAKEKLKSLLEKEKVRHG